MKKSLLKICAPVMAVCMLSACGSSATETTTGDGLFEDGVSTTVAETETTVAETTVAETTVAETTVEETEAKVLVIGDEATGTVSVHLMNTTDEDITAVYIKVKGGEYSDNLLSETFKVGEDRVMYYNNSSDAEDAKYTVKIVFASGTEDSLHNFTFTDFVGADICYKNGQVYIAYKDVTGDKSTYDAEVAYDTPVETQAPAGQDNGCIGDDGLFY